MKTYLEYFHNSTEKWERMTDKTGSNLIFENVDQRWAAEQVALANPFVAEVRFVDVID